MAARSGVSTRALRYYEEQQLLTASRSPGGQRQYPDGAVERVRLIQQLYAAGLGSKAIVDLLPCVYTGVATPEMVTRLATERDRIDQQVQELAQTRDRLDAVIATAERSHHIPCVQEPAQPRYPSTGGRRAGRCQTCAAPPTLCATPASQPFYCARGVSAVDASKTRA